jgi:5-hydroxyisourate hydrolase-like protein (transthyretin family)
VSGALIEHATGRPVAGVEVEVALRGEAGQQGTTARGVTDASGRYHVVLTATSATLASVTVRPRSPWREYTVPDVPVRVTTTRGDGVDLGRWVVDPYVAFVGEILNRRNNVGLAGSGVVFRRKDGAPLAVDSLRADADDHGRFFWFGRALGLGEVRGDMEVRSPTLGRAVQLPDVTLRVEYRDVAPSLGRVWQLGASLQYAGELFERVSRRLVTDATVQFRRTGGIRVQPDTFTVTTDAVGRFPLVTTPLADAGTVVGELVVTRPGRAPTVIRNVRMPVYDTDEVRLLQTWGVGPSLLWVGELHGRGSRLPISGAEVRVHRTGGIAVSPETFTVRSDATGRFPLVTQPLADSGTVIVELTITRPGVTTPDVLRDVAIPTFDDDSVKLLRVWGIGGWVNYAGILFHRSTGAPAENVEVEFRRTGGITARPDTFTVRSNFFGGFPMTPATDGEGELIGDLIIRPPAPLRPTTVRGVRLPTFAADELRRIDNYGIGPSLQYFGELLGEADGRPIVGARVEFRRTGGVEATPGVITATSNADGRFRLAPVTSSYGQLTGELTVRWGTPERTTTFRDVALETFESDEVRLLRSWRLPNP